MFELLTKKFAKWVLIVFTLFFVFMVVTSGLPLDHPGVLIVNIMIVIIASLVATILIIEWKIL